MDRSLAKQLGVAGPEAAVAADVEIPALLGGDDADVLAAGLGALAGAAGHARLDLVRRAQPPVAQFQRDGQADRVLHAVPAPGGADARLHRAQRLAVRVAGLEAGVDEPPPDRGQLLDPGAEQVDPLAAGDLRVEPEVAGHLADDDQPLRGDLAARDPRDDRVGAVALDVGQEVVVGVLQRGLLAVEHVLFVVLARIEAIAGLQMSQPRPRPCAATSSLKVVIPRTRTRSNSSCRLWSKCSHSAFGSATPDSASNCLTSGTQEPQVVPALVQALTAGDVGAALLADRAGDRALGDGVAGADLRLPGSGDVRPGAGRSQQDQRRRGQRPAEARAQRGVRGGVADEDAAEQRLRVVGEHELLVDPGDRVGEGHVQRPLDAPRSWPRRRRAA